MLFMSHDGVIDSKESRADLLMQLSVFFLQPSPLQQPELRLSPGLVGTVAQTEADNWSFYSVHLPSWAQRTQRGRGAEARIQLLR